MPVRQSAGARRAYTTERESHQAVSESIARDVELLSQLRTLDPDGNAVDTQIVAKAREGTEAVDPRKVLHIGAREVLEAVVCSAEHARLAAEGTQLNRISDCSGLPGSRRWHDTVLDVRMGRSLHSHRSRGAIPLPAFGFEPFRKCGCIVESKS